MSKWDINEWSFQIYEYMDFNESEIRFSKLVSALSITLILWAKYPGKVLRTLTSLKHFLSEGKSQFPQPKNL